MKNDPVNQTSILCQCARFICVPLAGLLVALMMPAVAISQSPATVDLGTASSFAVLAAAGVTGTAVIKGDVGTSTATIDVGITAPGYTIYAPGDATVTTAHNDLTTAYNNATGRSSTDIGVELGGITKYAGVYSSGTFGLTGTLTLNGSATDVFIFQMATTLTTAAASNVILINGAQWTNVFWQVGSSATLGTGSVFEGTILALASITANGGEGTTIHGRLLARDAAVTFTGVTDLSLPVTLSEFKANISGNSVCLSWITSSEVENLGFMIERKESGGEWFEIASFTDLENLAGHGNTSAEYQYAYTDSKVAPGKTYSYRLLDVDFAGIVKIHNDRIQTITVPESIGIPKSYELVGAYPNPFNSATTIAFSVPETAPVQITVYNVLGQKTRLLQNREYRPGYHKISWDATDDHGRLVPGGVYFVMISSGQFIKVQKVILLK